MSERERRAYNRDVKAMHVARDTLSVKDYEKHLIDFDIKWCPEVVERRKNEGLYAKWARERI